jgi:hypothetical protein
VLKLNLLVVLACALLPDLIDKPLWAMGIGGPRFVAHTILFMLVAAGVAFLWRRRHGLAVLLGWGSHLFLDWAAPGAPIPWLYPFKGYSFPERELDPSAFFSNLFESIESYFLMDIGGQLIWVAAAFAAALVLLRFRRRYLSRKKGQGEAVPSNRRMDMSR